MRALIEDWARRPIVKQATRFAMVGAVATLIHYAILIGLVEAFAIAPIVGSTLGFVVGLCFSYVTNRRFTFESQAAHRGTLIKYVALYGVGLLLNGAIMAALMTLGASYLFAQVAATGIVLVWNFAGARWLVFGAGR
jgi:putative flippase GtrA